MSVPRQRSEEMEHAALEKGPAARTRKLMVHTAADLMRRGGSPSVTDVAAAAGVSRSTAYRYFPTLADMLRAVVAEALGPILTWKEGPGSVDERLADLYGLAFPRIFEHGATFRAALRQSLDPAFADSTLGRGHRRELIARATKGIDLPPAAARRLRAALSLTFGIEATVVLRDICGLADEEVQETAIWAAQAMLKAALDQKGERE
jgi:AcrR family transcriptional regulator